MRLSSHTQACGFSPQIYNTVSLVEVSPSTDGHSFSTKFYGNCDFLFLRIRGHDGSGRIGPALQASIQCSRHYLDASHDLMDRDLPMTPVEATKTALAGIFRMSAAASAVALQYPYPSTPVQALAIPALMMTAWADGAWYTISWFHLTGAAFTRLVVKVPAALHGTSL